MTITKKIDRVELALYEAGYEMQWREFKNARRNGHVNQELRICSPWKYSATWGFKSYFGSTKKDCVMRLIGDKDNRILVEFFKEFYK